MPNLVLTRKAGESLTFKDKAGNKLVLQVKEFTKENAVFKATDKYFFDLNPHERIKFMGGEFEWAPSRGRDKQIRMIMNFPNTVNIVRSELLAC